MHDKHLLTHENIQNLSTNITIHIMHILQQYGKGCITGVNTNRWKKHVVANTRLMFAKISVLQVTLKYIKTTI